MSILLPAGTARPTLIASAPLRARRLGPASGEWLIGLLLSAWPVALLVALDHCATLTSRVARGLTAGGSARAALMLGCVALALRGWRSSTALVVGTATFLATAASLASAGLTVPLLLGCALATLLIGLRLVPARAVAPTQAPTRRDPDLRMVTATCLVLAVTTFACMLGPGLDGVAMTFPLVSTIVILSVHRTGAEAAVAVYRGLLVGLFALGGFATRFPIVPSRLPIGTASRLAGLAPSIELDPLWTSQRTTVKPA